jgi:hypothetical protein
MKQATFTAITAMIMFFLSLPLPVAADPAPFGLEIGQTTVEEMRAKYAAKKTGINKYSNGEMYALDTSSIAIDGLQEATVIFSEDGRLLAVLTTFPKHKFDYLLDVMNSKYRVVSKQIPFVGSKSAKFVDGNTEIILDAPHLSFQMEMNYISKDFLKAYREQSEKEQQQKEKREQSQL